MYKDGVSIHIDELGKWSTSEKNGLEVKVTINVDRNGVDELKRSFLSLIYFNCIYLDDSQNLLQGFARVFNERKVKHYKTFSIHNRELDNISNYYSSKSSYLDLRVGNCIYPLDKYQLAKDEGIPSDWNITIRLDIGEVDVTPNREAILYNPKTELALKKRFKEVIAEVKELVLSNTKNLNFDSLLDYYKMHSLQYYGLVVEIDDTCSFELKISNSLLASWNYLSACKIKNQAIPSSRVMLLLNRVFAELLPKWCVKFYYNSSTGNYYSDVPQYTSLSIRNLITKHKVYLTEDAVWRSITKRYAKENIIKDEVSNKYNSAILILNKKKVIKYVYDELLPILVNMDKASGCQNLRFILKNLDWTSEFISINEQDIPEEYKKKFEEEKKPKQQNLNTTSPKKARSCVIYTCVTGEIYDYHYHTYKAVLDSVIYTLESLPDSRTIVYTAKDDGDSLAYLKELFLLYKYTFKVSDPPVFIAVAPSNIPSVAALSNSMSLDEFINSPRQEFKVIASIDHMKYQQLKGSVGRVRSVVTNTLTGALNNLMDRYLELTSICSLEYVSLGGGLPSTMSSIIEKYKQKNLLCKEILDIQNNEKLWVFLTISESIAYGKLSNLIAAEYAQRLGLDTMTKETYKEYTESKYFKHIKIN